MRHSKEFETIKQMISIYCREKHSTKKLCSDCENLLTYAQKRLELCPYDPKPKCKDCKTHCYSPANRQKVKDVMRFSGMFMVKRGRLDLLVKYFLKDKIKKLLHYSNKASK